MEWEMGIFTSLPCTGPEVMVVVVVDGMLDHDE